MLRAVIQRKFKRADRFRHTSIWSQKHASKCSIHWTNYMLQILSCMQNNSTHVVNFDIPCAKPERPEMPWGLRQFTVKDLDGISSISTMPNQTPHNKRLESASSPG